MSERRAVISPKAREDLTAIENYVAEHGGEALADGVIVRINKTISTLAYMPGIGNFRPYLRPGDRIFPVSPWTIIYRELREGDGIFVFRIIDGRRDLAALFEP